MAKNPKAAEVKGKVGASAPAAETNIDAGKEGSEKPAAPTRKYDKATSRKVKALLDAGKELVGDEEPGLIDTYFAELEAEGGEEATEAEEVPGVPNKLPIRTEAVKVANKEYNFPLFFVAPVKGGFAMYNEAGKRVSPAYSAAADVSKLNKDCARNNLLRRTSRTASDFQKGDF